MPRLEVPIGTRFGRLVVAGEAGPATHPSGQSHRRMKCRCDCGVEVAVLLPSLRNGNTKSCGCFSFERRGQTHLTHGQAKKGKQSPNYRMWARVKSRAVTGSTPDSYHWLGRGITMYEPWTNSFEAFDDWVTENLGEKPKGHSLDRINNDGNYEPGNLRWATAKEQSNNRRDNQLIIFNGITRTTAQWAEELGMNKQTLWGRLFNSNWPVDKALTTPVRSIKNAD